MVEELLGRSSCLVPTLICWFLEYLRLTVFCCLFAVRNRLISTIVLYKHFSFDKNDKPFPLVPLVCHTPLVATYNIVYSGSLTAQYIVQH